MRNYRAKIASWLSHAAAWIEGPLGEPENQSKFHDLAPTDTADEAGVYSDALFAAMANTRVFNIALTGPYGSGKSSIIKSFLKKYRGDSLQISLAAFLPESGPRNLDIEPGNVESTPVRTKPTRQGRERATKQEIERSILQQMLYGADANKLPFSRFKRIQTPGRYSSIFVSLFIALGLLSWWHLFQKRDVIVKGDYFAPFGFSNWFNLTCFALGAALLLLVVHRFYVASFGVSLKSLSLKDIQIAPAAIDQESILNRHLDEIIYFFQATKYDLVIVEDLDRFNDPEIFVTLREINKIVNENSGVKRTIRFLYALRDDMFVNTDRTKFFEFIIPVIPIINSSNSVDMVFKEGKRISIDDRLEPQFLREVSRYLNDLRLIKNIFNEYEIYAKNLETDDANVLNANKLLAVLIYKNVFPSDFEALHRGEGNLAQILHRHDIFVANVEAECKVEITDLEGQIEVAEKQLPADFDELRRIYAMAVIENGPEGYAFISVDGSNFISIQSLAKNEGFEQFLVARQLIFRNFNNHHHRQNVADLPALAGAQEAFQRRKDQIAKKSADFRDEANARIRELRASMANLRKAKFNEIIRQNAEATDDLFKAFRDKAELARFLVFEGYLDDTYYQYTSLFHAGRLSPNDNKFLRQIRGFTNPEPDFQIDNAKEVVAEMREEDFNQNYVLNVKIVDCLLSEPSAYSTQTMKLFEFIASDFGKCEAFFKAYYASGVARSTLVAGLTKAWPTFIPTVMASNANLSHMAHIIAELPAEDLSTLPRKYPGLSEFVSTNLPQILALGIDFEPSRLKLLEIKATDLAGIADHPGIARFLFEEGLYQLSITNLDFIFRSILGIEDEQTPHKKHYTTVLNAGNAALIARIDGNIREYVDSVLLRLEGNTEESLPAILSIINREELEIESLKVFLEKQSALVPALDYVSPRFHASLFELAKIDPSWENCLEFLSSENYDADALTGYLNIDDVAATLSRFAVPDGEQAFPLRKFLVENEALDDDLYASYVRALPGPIQKFPEDVGWDKLQILIEEKKVLFSVENLSFLSEDSDFQVLFAAKNIDRYLEIESECAPDDDFRERLLGSDIQDDQKLRIVRAMDLTLLAGIPSRAGKVGPILFRTGTDVSEFGADAATAVIVNSRPINVQISLLNKFQQNLDDERVRTILRSLPAPFSEIKPGYGIPRLESTEANLELVRWLQNRRFISSWNQGGWLRLDNDIRINLFRK